MFSQGSPVTSEMFDQLFLSMETYVYLAQMTLNYKCFSPSNHFHPVVPMTYLVVKFPASAAVWLKPKSLMKFFV